MKTFLLLPLLLLLSLLLLLLSRLLLLLPVMLLLLLAMLLLLLMLWLLLMLQLPPLAKAMWMMSGERWGFGMGTAAADLQGSAACLTRAPIAHAMPTQNVSACPPAFPAMLPPARARARTTE